MCLGVEHVPVGPLSREQTELARLAASTSNHGDTKPGESERQGDIMHCRVYSITLATKITYLYSRTCRF